MAGNVLVDPNRLETRMAELVSKYKFVAGENHRLKKQLADCLSEKMEIEARLKKLETDYDRLKLARAFGWSEESKRRANDRISKLVRDIDYCLNLLNE
ncbi:MAG: hypothetical protein ACI3Z7_07945 [Candidatus Aphodosoma sp.]